MTGSVRALLLICGECWTIHNALGLTLGRKIEWTAFAGPTPVDLPGFVKHLTKPRLKGGLRTTLRMETPVLYFHSPRDVTSSVKVAFSRGVITE